MIRVLVMIAVAGFLVSVVTLSTAVAIGGPEAISRGAWAWNGDRWGWGDHIQFGERRWGHHWGHRWDSGRDDGPQTTRDIAWSGGDSLDIDVPADIHYTQAAGPAKLTVTGPQGAVQDLQVTGGHIGYADGGYHRGHLTIVMTAPAVKRFQMSGSGRLAIDGFNQDSLSLVLSGDSDVSASGQSKAVSVDISGSAGAKLGDLKTASAEVSITGSGEATVAPTERAKIEISGSGDVNLLTHPATLESDISGSGRIHQAERGVAAPAAPAAPATPAKKARI